ncbi:MAG: hypothetical protein Q8S33_30080 [Myxococcales bacterium]|nr:hypothetical protein [Myxococcales bacterium]MDP3504626.1 hypothetical protein [Myxococcales bacterium]
MTLALLAIVGLFVAAGVLRALSGAGIDRPDPSGLRSVARFQATEFARVDAAQDENPSSWGEDLLKTVLARLGPPFKVSMHYAPGYGHAAVVEGSDQRFTLSLGFVSDSEGWLLSANGRLEHSPVPDSEMSRELLRQVHAALTTLAGVAEVHWSDRESFRKNSPMWAAAPLD